jgi:hypothetical protein
MRRAQNFRARDAQDRRLIQAVGLGILLEDAELRARNSRLRQAGFARGRLVMRRDGPTIGLTLCWLRADDQESVTLEFKLKDWPDWTRTDVRLEDYPHRRIFRSRRRVAAPPAKSGRGWRLAAVGALNFCRRISLGFGRAQQGAPKA